MPQSQPRLVCQFNEAIRDLSDIVSGPSGDLRGIGKCCGSCGGSGSSGV